MGIENEIRDYISCEENTGALLVTGKWGCGKTFLMKNIVNDINNKNEAAMSIISLFGIDDTVTVDKKIKVEYATKKYGNISTKIHELQTSTKKKMKQAANAIEKLSSAIPGTGVAAAGMNILSNIDIFDIVKVTNNVGKDNNEKKFVLVFDDFERCCIDIQTLIGLINELVENKEIKVIILADEEKLNEGKYKEYKEKTVSRTIRLLPDHRKVLSEIITNYRDESGKYKDFLKRTLNTIFLVFEESESDNFRIMKYILADFRRVHDIWISQKLPYENLEKTLYCYAAEMFFNRDFQHATAKIEDETKALIERAKGIKKKYSQYKDYNCSFQSLSNWVEKGIWDEDQFVKEIKGRFKKQDILREYKFLYLSLWELQQEDLNIGIPFALELAYKGGLDDDSLLSFMNKIFILRKHNIGLPCKVDYHRIEEAYDKRINEIKEGNRDYTGSRLFVDDKEVDEEAKDLYEKIKRMQEKAIAFENRRLFIQYLRGNDVQATSLYNKCIDKFDDELYDLFISAYKSNTNKKKREYALLFIRLGFSSHYSDDRDKSITGKNFDRLISWLSEYRTTDSISNLISQTFIEKIKEMKSDQKL